MKIYKLFFIALLFATFLLLFLLVFDLSFAATAPNSASSRLAYFLTESGGIMGTTLGIVFACFLYTLKEIGRKNKLLVFLKSFTGLAIIISLFAALNEKFTKPMLKWERPSHMEILQRLEKNHLLDSLYALSKEERVAFFGLQVKENAKLFQNIDPLVLQHWVEEGGYSFPSGHTFNAFLLAMIFAFGIAQNRVSVALQKTWWIPFLWATGVAGSRVALGAHSVQDVAAGALMGICLGALLLHIDHTRHWITHKQKPNQNP